MDGCIGLSMLVNRDTGHCIVTSAWRDEESMHASNRNHSPRQHSWLDGVKRFFESMRS